MINTEQYLKNLKSQLLKDENFKPLLLTKGWAKGIPSKPGVYALKNGNDLVYVGETGNLKGRMNDMMDSRHHTVRRTLGERNFSNHIKFFKATSKSKFDFEIEELLNNYMAANLQIAYLEVSLGRKELEEEIEKSIDITLKLNKRGLRIAR